MKITRQYRVSFTAQESVNGNIVDVRHSTKWYDDYNLCLRWSHKDNAEIITRLNKEESFQEYKIRKQADIFLTTN